MEAVEFLEKFKDWIQHATLISWLGNIMNWAVTKGLYWLSSQSESLIDEAFKVFDFLNYGQVGTIYTGFKLVSWTILAIMIVVLGLKMIGNKKIKMKESTIRVIIMATLIVQMPSLITKGVELNEKLFTESKSLVLNTGNQLQSTGNESLSFNIVKQNVADLNYIAYEGFDTLLDPESAKNKLTKKTFDVVDLSQILIPKDVTEIATKSKNKDAEHLSSYLANSADGKTLEAVDIETGWFDFFKEGTFRYKANHSAMNIGFIVLIIFNLLLFGKLIILLIDLVFGKIYFPLSAFSDIETGQRSKKMIEGIVTNLFTIGFLGISASLFVIFYSFLVSLQLSLIAFALTAIIGAFAFIKGSDTLAKTFGINTSIKEGAVGLAGMYGAMKLGQAGAKVAGTAGQAVKETAKAVPKQAQKSIQKAGEKVNSMAETLGTEFGHIDERGFGGAMKDKANGAINNVSEGVENLGKKVSEPLAKTKDSFDTGVAEGISKGVNNRSAENSKKQPLPDHVPDGSRQVPSHDGKPTTTTPPSDPKQSPSIGGAETDHAGGTSLPKEPHDHVESFDKTVASQEKDEAIKSAVTPPTPPSVSPIEKYNASMQQSVGEQAENYSHQVPLESTTTNSAPSSSNTQVTQPISSDRSSSVAQTTAPIKSEQPTVSQPSSTSHVQSSSQPKTEKKESGYQKTDYKGKFD